MKTLKKIGVLALVAGAIILGRFTAPETKSTEEASAAPVSEVSEEASQDNDWVEVNLSVPVKTSIKQNN